MTASFSRIRRCNRSSEAAIAGVMLRPNRIGNSEGGEFCFFAAGEVPLPPGETPGGDGEAPAGASTCRAVAAAAGLARVSIAIGSRVGRRRLTQVEALSCLPQLVFDASKAALAFSGGQLTKAEHQHCQRCRGDVVAVGIELQINAAVFDHATAPSLAMTVLVGAVRCR